MVRNGLIFLLILVAIHMTSYWIKAEQTSQSITLQPGWNAIFLEVEPGIVYPGMDEETTSTDPENVFSQINDLQSVWKWNSLAGTVTVEFIQNPDLLVPEEPQMLVYIPTGLPGDVVTNLHAIQGNSAYLVYLGGSVDQNLTVEGEPAIPHHEWKANSFNFVGFHLVQDQEPSFENFFAASPAQVDQEIYTLDNATGNWVSTSAAEPMARGEGFWVYCNGSSSFNGPVAAKLEQFQGLHYGTELSEQEVVFRNDSPDPRTVDLSLQALPPLQEAIYYWVFDAVDGVASWEPLPASLDLALDAGASQRIRLGVKRAGLAADQSYGTNLGVTSGGYSFQLPLSVTGIDYGGLWTGYAKINKVSDQNKAEIVGEVPVRDETPLPTGSEFSFRLIVHAEDNGPVRLLSQVIQMWQEGTWKPDPDNLGKFIIDDPGNFVLLTDDTLVDNYTGASLRDGQPVGRRISAPVFPRLSAEQAMMATSPESQGIFPEPGYELEIDIWLEKDDPTNPFRHQFHKIHGPVENAIRVERKITLTFGDEDEDGNPITGLPKLDWGSSEIGGVYTERVSELHKDPIFIKGIFVLHRVSDIATLAQ